MYSIYLEAGAEKDLSKLPTSIFNTVIVKIRELGDEPRPRNCRKLKGSGNFWRIRIGNYRVIYEVIDSSKRINIYKIKHRKDAFR